MTKWYFKFFRISIIQLFELHVVEKYEVENSHTATSHVFEKWSQQRGLDAVFPFKKGEVENGHTVAVRYKSYFQ